MTTKDQRHRTYKIDNKLKQKNSPWAKCSAFLLTSPLPAWPWAWVSCPSSISRNSARRLTAASERISIDFMRDSVNVVKNCVVSQMSMWVSIRLRTWGGMGKERKRDEPQRLNLSIPLVPFARKWSSELSSLVKKRIVQGMGTGGSAWMSLMLRAILYYHHSIPADNESMSRERTK